MRKGKGSKPSLIGNKNASGPHRLKRIAGHTARSTLGAVAGTAGALGLFAIKTAITGAKSSANAGVAGVLTGAAVGGYAGYKIGKHLINKRKKKI
jgi:hypothetical protein